MYFTVSNSVSVASRGSKPELARRLARVEVPEVLGHLDALRLDGHAAAPVAVERRLRARREQRQRAARLHERAPRPS